MEKSRGEIIDKKELDYFISATKYNEFTKKYGSRFGVSVAEGAVETGISEIMVLDAIGHPKHINTTKSNNKVREQWVYYSNAYLHFENGILKSIQD